MYFAYKTFFDNLNNYYSTHLTLLLDEKHTYAGVLVYKTTETNTTKLKEAVTSVVSMFCFAFCRERISILKLYTNNKSGCKHL